MSTHVDDTFQAKLGTDGGCGHAVLPGPCFRDDPGLAHAPRQNDLAQHVVDLVRAGVVQLITFEVNLRPTQMLGQPLSVVQRRRATHVVGP